MGSIPGSGRFPGGEHGNPLQYSCLENLMDRGAWWAIGLQELYTLTKPLSIVISIYKLPFHFMTCIKTNLELESNYSFKLLLHTYVLFSE